MHDLEAKISAWRNQMLSAGIKSPVPLEELENHLREALDQQMEAGANPEEAFASAVRQIGSATSVQGEFKKLTGINSMKRKMIVLMGVFVLLLGISMILPALGKHKQRHHTFWTEDELFGLWMGSTMALTGTTVTALALARRTTQPQT